MQIARVVGTVVSTQKHRKFEGAKLLLVQPLDLDRAPRGSALLAIDGVGAGVGADGNIGSMKPGPGQLLSVTSICSSIGSLLC